MRVYSLLFLLASCAGTGEPADTGADETGNPATIADAILPLGSVSPNFDGPLHIMDLSGSEGVAIAASYSGAFGIDLADPTSPRVDAQSYGSELYWVDSSTSAAWGSGRTAGLGRMEHDGAGQLSGPTARPVQRIEGIEVVGDVLYAAHQDAGLSWFDANTMATLGNDQAPTNAIDLASADGMIWVADRERGLLGYTLVEGQAPSLDAELPLEGSAQAIDALPGVVVIASGGRVHLVDTSSKTSPRLAWTIAIEGIATRVALKDRGTLAVAAWNDTRVYDIAELDAPALIALEDATSSAMSVTWAGEVLVVGDWDDLRTYSVDLDAQAPEWTGPSRLTANGDAGTAVSAAFLVKNEGSLDLQLEEASCAGAELAVEPSQLLIEPGVTAVLQLVGTFGSTSTEEARCTFITNDPDEPSVEVEVVLNEIGLSVGDAAPDFSVPNLEGTDVYTLQDARGEILLLTIFSSL